MIIVPMGEQFFLVPQNSSKEEIKNLIIKRRKLGAQIVAISIAAVGFILWFLVNTELKDLYTAFGQPIPVLTQLAPIISIILGISIYFFLQQILGKEVDYVSVTTNEGKLKITLVPNTNDGLWVFFIVGIAVGILVLMYVLPIYSISSSM